MMKPSHLDSRYNMREWARQSGLDPGTGPSLEDHVTDATSEAPTLEAMTTLRYEHPKIGPVGQAPRGRTLSGPPQESRPPRWGH